MIYTAFWLCLKSLSRDQEKSFANPAKMTHLSAGIGANLSNEAQKELILHRLNIFCNRIENAIDNIFTKTPEEIENDDNDEFEEHDEKRLSVFQNFTEENGDPNDDGDYMAVKYDNGDYDKYNEKIFSEEDTFPWDPGGGGQ